MCDKKIILNNVEITEEELNKKKEEIENQKNIKLVEVAPNVYKTKLYD